VRKLVERLKTRPDKKVDAFRDESVSTIFDLEKINAQLEHNELYDVHKTLTRETFFMENNIPDTKVIGPLPKRIGLVDGFRPKR
jgi:hypothetical protein